MNECNAILHPYRLSVQEIEKLDGYSSINYRVRSDGTNYLLKHYLDANEYHVIWEEDQILKSLAGQKLPFQVPAGVKEIVSYGDGSFSRLLPYIEGSLLSATPQTDSLLFSLGESAGILNNSLLGLKNDVIQARVLTWDMKYTMHNQEKTVHITNQEEKKIVNYYLDLFQHRVLPVQHQLRHCIIHSDLNDTNVIVEDKRVIGIIDFGDISYSPLIYEVAIALTYIIMANEESSFDKAAAFIKGYHSVLPLKKEEVGLLHLLIPSRLCTSVLNSAQKKADGEGTEHVLISEKPAWKLLRQWISMNPLWIANFFLDALDFPVEKPETSALLKNRLVKKRSKYTGASLATSFREPIYMTGGAFQYMYDNEGNTFLDAYNNIPHVGHCHPNISKVISNQARRLNTNTRYLYPELTAYATQLCKTLPSILHKLFLLNSGSAASDLAVRMARTYNKKTAIAILESGYHGHTATGIDISDYKHRGKGGEGTPSDIITLPLPKLFKGKFDTSEAYVKHAKEVIDQQISKGVHPAALIAEPISGCGGQVPLADGYLKELKPFLEERNILLIVDEVQTGFGRLGKYFWGFEQHHVIPDLLILGKPMGNGHPVAAVVSTPEVAEQFATGMEFFSSFGGNPVSCAVASEVLTIIQQESLQKNALEVGSYLKNELLDLKNRYDCMGDVRGEGLFLGIEFLDPDGNPGTQLASFIKEGLKKNYILVGTDGPYENVIKIKPPLCFNKQNAAILAENLAKTIELALSVAPDFYSH